MRYVFIAESVEQLGGAETVAINIADYIIRKNVGAVVFLYKSGNEPNNLTWSHNITEHVKNKATFIKVKYDWSDIVDNIHNDDIVLIQPDWDGPLMAKAAEINLHCKCKIVTFCHCDAFAPISYYEHPSHNYAEAFEKLRPYIDLAVALNPMDQYYFECIGIKSIWWQFGTRALPQSVPGRSVIPFITSKETPVYNRVVAVASNWDRPFKNRPEADKLLKIAEKLGYEVIRYGKASDGSSTIGTYEDIYKQGTIMVMASFAEARSDQILEANQANIPVLCKAKWVPDLYNQFTYKSLEDAERILKKLKGKKIKKYSSKSLMFDNSMPQLLVSISRCNDLVGNGRINLETTCGKAYINNLMRSADMVCHNVETDYSNNIVSLKYKLASVVLDGRSKDEITEMYGREIRFTSVPNKDYEYIVFANNKLLQHNVLGEKLKSLGHASIITDRQNMFIAIQSKLLSDSLILNIDHEPSTVFGAKLLETINSNSRYKFYKKLIID